MCVYLASEGFRELLLSGSCCVTSHSSPTLSFIAGSVFPGNLLFYRQSWFCVSSACDYPIFRQCTEQQTGLYLIETSLVFQKAAENGWQEEGEYLFTQCFDGICSSVSQFKWGRSSSISSCLSSSVIPAWIWCFEDECRISVLGGINVSSLHWNPWELSTQIQYLKKSWAARSIFY